MHTASFACPRFPDRRRAPKFLKNFHFHVKGHLWYAAQIYLLSCITHRGMAIAYTRKGYARLTNK